jgi:hypothetical protein
MWYRKFADSSYDDPESYDGIRGVESYPKDNCRPTLMHDTISAVSDIAPHFYTTLFPVAGRSRDDELGFRTR